VDKQTPDCEYLKGSESTRSAESPGAVAEFAPKEGNQIRDPYQEAAPQNVIRPVRKDHLGRRNSRLSRSTRHADEKIVEEESITSTADPSQ
jgi:hypothetical protein